MRDVLKLLLFVCTVTLVASRLHPASHKKSCSEGHYNFKGICFQCTPCGDFLYEQEKCSATSNTVCGWCGKKPNLDEISDEVLASYQTKCLMSSLDFIGMTELKDELINVFDEEEEKVEKSPVRDTIISGENLEVIDASEHDDYFNMAKESLNNFDDSEEQELPDPTYEEGKDSSSSEEMDSDKAEEEAEIDDTVSDRVTAYLNEKTHKTAFKLPSTLEELAIIKGSRILSREEVMKSFNELTDFIKSRKILPRGSAEFYDSAEESNERDIKWDSWVDDEVKPLAENVEIVEAEEINKAYDAYIELPKPIRRGPDQNIEVMSAETEKNNFTALIRSLSPIFFVLGFIVTLTLASMAFVQMRAARQTFLGVPTDSQDYHMIIDASKYVEELEKKEKLASRHVHVNPGFDV